MKRGRPGRILKMAVRQVFCKPATILYPKGKMQIADKYRGRLVYDPSNCVGCNLCMRYCPAGALKIVNDGTKENRKMKAYLNVGHCIFCCQCVDSCPKKCLSFSQDIDLSSFRKEDLTVCLNEGIDEDK
ncbi:MAG TPA: 4Fe-4S dicluster domain-containing protein [Clostridia bacterium]|nr:4Fe-4S binding protein [Clostridiales bacterium]